MVSQNCLVELLLSDVSTGPVSRIEGRVVTQETGSSLSRSSGTSWPAPRVASAIVGGPACRQTFTTCASIALAGMMLSPKTRAPTLSVTPRNGFTALTAKLAGSYSPAQARMRITPPTDSAGGSESGNTVSNGATGKSTKPRSLSSGVSA